MAYDSTTKIISAPVSFYDVQRCLAKSSPNLNELCKASNINKWSKYKPVKFSTFSAITLEQLKSINFGLNINIYNTLANIVAAIEAGINWNYIPPTGGIESQYRLHDFNNYCHAAQNPIVIDVPNIVFNHKPGSVAQVSMFLDETDYNIKLSEIPAIKDLYFGAYIVKTNGYTGARLMTSKSTIANGGIVVDIPIYGLPLGAYYIYPLLSDTPINDALSIPSGVIYAGLDSVPKYNLIMRDSPIAIAITASWHNDLHDSGQIDYTIEITNDSGTDYPINNCYTLCKFSTHDITDHIVMGETQVSKGNIIVPANGIYTITDSFIADYYDSPSGFNVWFTSGNPSFEAFESVFDGTL